MKKKLLLFTASCGLIYLSLSSNSSGPAQNSNGDRTGRINAGNTCVSGGCHSGGSGLVTCVVEVRRKAWGASSTPVTGFIAGDDYLITLKGTHPSLTKFGFQLLAVEGSKTGTTQFGTFSNLPSGTHSKTVTGVDIIEHSTALSKTGSDYVVNLEWKAPATTSATTMTFCAVINAVNGNGVSTGDIASELTSLTLQNTTSIENVTGSMHINAYPNPVVGNNLNLAMDNVQQGDYDINVYSVNGTHIYQKEMKVNTNQASTTVNTERWAAGLYIIHINNGEHQKMINVIKQ